MFSAPRVSLGLRSLANRTVRASDIRTNAASVHTCAVVCPKDAGPILKAMPVRSDVEFIIGNDMADFEGHTDRVESLMFIATGGNPALMPVLFDACKNVKWTHSLFAGVDALAPFIASHLSKYPLPPAFISSLSLPSLSRFPSSSCRDMP